MNVQGKGILVLHPMIEGVERMAKFFVGAEDVVVKGLTEGPDVIHGREDVALAGLDSIRKAREAQKAGYQAIVLSCHGDPNLYSLREAVSIPVIGPMEVSMHLCAMLAHRFSILVPNLPIKNWQEENAIKYGFQSKIASIRWVPYKIPLEQVSELASNQPIPIEVIEPALKECIKAIKDDGATAITFGCGAFRWMAEVLKERLIDEELEVPVINPLPLAVDLARILIKHKLRFSSLCYHTLEVKKP